MSDSIADSGHDTNSTIDTTNTDTTGTSLTLGKVAHQRSSNASHVDILPQLPSHKFKFSVWHDLRETCLTGDQLHAPRVRQGPSEKEREFYEIEENGVPIHHDLRGVQRQNHMDDLENWESAKSINLAYQDLSHDYQKQNFSRILNRCKSAVTVNIVHNELVDLHNIFFPCCEYFNVDNNYLRSFKNLPKMPIVRCLTAVGNYIRSFDGLDRFSSTPLQELTLQGNPVSFKINYRATVFDKLPNLVLLDGIPRLPTDQMKEIDVEEPPSLSRCTIL